MCMSCGRSRPVTGSKPISRNTGSKSPVKQRKVYSGGSAAFGSPKVRMSFASRSR